MVEYKQGAQYMEMPGSWTLAQAREHILNSPDLDGVLGLVQITRSVRVRFVWTQGPRAEMELDDHHTVEFFRALAAQNRAKLVIDDQGGGLTVRQPEPELA